MAERLIEVKVYRVEYLCDKCGEVMQWSGMTLTLNPPKYPHRCYACDFTINLDAVYPHDETREIPE